MIALAKSCSGGGSLLNYIMSDKKGYELFRSNLCGVNPKEIMEEIKIIQDFNQRATNKTLSLVISPSIEDGNKLSDSDLREMTNEFLNQLNIDVNQHQLLAFTHTEKQHKHIHIYCNRLNMQTGRLVKDHHIGKRAQWIAHRIALKRNLVSAKQIMIDKIKSSEKKVISDEKSIKSQIYQKHLKAIDKHLNSFSEYIDVMKSMGVIVQPTINKQGLTQGHRIIDVATNSNFKASEVNRKMNLNDVGNNNSIKEKTTIKKMKHGR